MADHLTNRMLRDKAHARSAKNLILLKPQALAAACSTHVRRPREQFPDIDRDAISVHDHRPLGHRQVVREDADGVFFGGIELDDRTAAEPQHLVNGHGGGAEHHGDVDGDLVECGHVSSLIARQA